MDNQNTNQNINPAPLPTAPSDKNSEIRTLIAVLLLLFAFPIGLIFMWLATKWPKWVKLLATAPLILAFAGIAAALFLVATKPINKPQATPVPVGVACTMEAKSCPDGSYVSRHGPKCEFDACPSPAPAASSSADFSNWTEADGTQTSGSERNHQRNEDRHR